MGMFDSVLVPKKTNVGIPAAKGEYQTYAGETHAIFTITEEGVLTYTPRTPGDLPIGPDSETSHLVIGVKAGAYCDCYFSIHGDGEDGMWHEFELVEERGDTDLAERIREKIQESTGLNHQEITSQHYAG